MPENINGAVVLEGRVQPEVLIDAFTELLKDKDYSDLSYRFFSTDGIKFGFNPEEWNLPGYEFVVTDLSGLKVMIDVLGQEHANKIILLLHAKDLSVAQGIEGIKEVAGLVMEAVTPIVYGAEDDDPEASSVITLNNVQLPPEMQLARAIEKKMKKAQNIARPE